MKGVRLQGRSLAWSAVPRRAANLQGDARATDANRHSRAVLALLALLGVLCCLVLVFGVLGPMALGSAPLLVVPITFTESQVSQSLEMHAPSLMFRALSSIVKEFRTSTSMPAERNVKGLQSQPAGAICVIYPREGSTLSLFSADVMLLQKRNSTSPLVILGGCNATKMPANDRHIHCFWHVRRGYIPVAPLEDILSLVDGRTQVAWHNTTVWLAASVPNLFDVWNDILLPLGAATGALVRPGDVLRVIAISEDTKRQQQCFRNASRPKTGHNNCTSPNDQRPSINSKPSISRVLQNTLSYWLHGVAEDAELITGNTVTIPYLTQDLTSPTAVAEQPISSNHTVVHCFRSSQWLNASAVQSASKGHRIVSGDVLRQQISAATKERLAAHWGLTPYQRPIQSAADASFVIRGGSWKEMIASWILPSMAVPSDHALRQGVWQHASSSTSWGGRLGGCTPRLLLILRNKTRRVADGERIALAARTAGFDTAILVAENATALAQAHAARHADVLVAVHGQGLTWMVMMDGVSIPRCRFVLELRHYGRKLKGVHNVYELLAADQHLRYLGIPPDDVSFDADLLPSWRVSRAKLRLARRTFPQTLPEFNAQILHYDLDNMLRVLQHVYRQVAECVCLRLPPPLMAAAWENEYSGIVH
ncbi:membrane-associated protein, putative [Bodo saltans]|uniref:Membrane-associated protein, putative n=1 Tax=Bodo saltans TaxID=75058 RepID=A0A0S4JNY2_BODSA|nr:membrane-associated protein, putative [Bodo saltans]|eukprot:CUG90830.1 membrane-associated protein, putative [Bodo saltans]